MLIKLCFIVLIGGLVALILTLLEPRVNDSRLTLTAQAAPCASNTFGCPGFVPPPGATADGLYRMLGTQR